MRPAARSSSYAVARVQHVVVVHELHVAGLHRHRHVVLRIGAHRVDAVHRLARRVRRAGRVLVAARRLDVRADVAHEQPVAAPAEDRHRVPGLARRVPARRGGRTGTARRARPRARARCAPARCGSSRRWRRRSRRRSRPRRGRTGRRDRSRRSGTGTRCRRSRCRATSGRSRRWPWSVTSPSRWPFAFCGHGLPEVRPDAPVDRRRPLLAVAVDGHAADEHDAAAVDELAGDARRAPAPSVGSGNASRVMSSTSSQVASACSSAASSSSRCASVSWNTYESPSSSLRHSQPVSSGVTSDAFIGVAPSAVGRCRLRSADEPARAAGRAPRRSRR